MEIKIIKVYPVLENNLFGVNTHSLRACVEFPDKHIADMSIICDSVGKKYGFREAGQSVAYILSEDISLSKLEAGDCVEVDEVPIENDNHWSNTFIKS